MGLSFIKEVSKVVMLGPNGVGKSSLAKNIAFQAVVAGHTVLFTTAVRSSIWPQRMVATPSGVDRAIMLHHCW